MIQSPSKRGSGMAAFPKNNNSTKNFLTTSHSNMCAMSITSCLGYTANSLQFASENQYSKFDPKISMPKKLSTNKSQKIIIQKFLTVKLFIGSYSFLQVQI